MSDEGHITVVVGEGDVRETIILICPALLPYIQAVSEEGYEVAVGRDGHIFYVLDASEADAEGRVLPGFPVAFWGDGDHLASSHAEEAQPHFDKLDPILEAVSATIDIDEEHMKEFHHGE